MQVLGLINMVMPNFYVVFVLISLIGRSARFFAFAILIYVLGPGFVQALKQKSGLVTMTILLVTAGGFLAAYYMF